MCHAGEAGRGGVHSAECRHVIDISVEDYEFPRILLHLHDTSKMKQPAACVTR